MLCLFLLSARLATAQPGLPTVTPGWSPDQFRGGTELIELTLDRPLGSNESLAVLVSDTDVSALIDVLGTRIRFHPSASLWRATESEVVVMIRRDTTWTELAKLPIKVRNRFGLDEGRLQPTADVSSAGQVKEGANQPLSSARATYQDVTLRLGSTTTLRRAPWQLELNANGLGVSNAEQRLQYGERGADALPVDLTDYKVALMRGGTGLYAGNVQRADHRQLLGGFASRGVGGVVQMGRVVALDAAVMNGTNAVGFSNMLGLERAEHRVAAAKLSMELLPRRPGALHMIVSGMDGSLLPRQNYNQSSVTDAEQSTGWGGQLDVAVPGNRVAFSGGLAQSRFRSPFDPLLAGDSAIVAVRPETRTARFGEMRVQLLQGRRILDSLTMDLSVTARHERIDPMYRAVGSSMQADMQSNGTDIAASVGTFTVALQRGQSRDNLANLASLLTSRTNTTGLTAALPLVSVFGNPGDWYLPTVSYNRNGTHQYGEGLPTNGEFSDADVPDQLSVTQSAALDWSCGSHTLGYRWNGSNQDNRQPGRETADIDGSVHTVSIGAAPRDGISLTFELSRERQAFAETGDTQGLDRIGAIARWQIDAHTDVSGNVSRSTTAPNPNEAKRTNMELQIEASRAFSFFRVGDGQPTTRVFLRFARSLQSENPLFVGAISSRSIRWTLNAGGSVRIF